MWRNAPSEATGVSPAQLMFGRPCRTFLPTARSVLSPAPPVPVYDALVKAQQTQAEYFNRGTRSLRPLIEGETVRMRLPGRSTWSPGICLRSVGDRSYLVRVDNFVYRRNRRHLLATNEDPSVVPDLPERPRVPVWAPHAPPANSFSRPERPPIPPSVPGTVAGGVERPPSPLSVPGLAAGGVGSPPSHGAPAHHGGNNHFAAAPLSPRRSGRVSQPPSYLRDYVR